MGVCYLLNEVCSSSRLSVSLFPFRGCSSIKPASSCVSRGLVVYSTRGVSKRRGLSVPSYNRNFLQFVKSFHTRLLHATLTHLIRSSFQLSPFSHETPLRFRNIFVISLREEGTTTMGKNEFLSNHSNGRFHEGEHEPSIAMEMREMRTALTAILNLLAQRYQSQDRHAAPSTSSPSSCVIEKDTSIGEEHGKEEPKAEICEVNIPSKTKDDASDDLRQGQVQQSSGNKKVSQAPICANEGTDSLHIASLGESVGRESRKPISSNEDSKEVGDSIPINMKLQHDSKKVNIQVSYHERDGGKILPNTERFHSKPQHFYEDPFWYKRNEEGMKPSLFTLAWETMIKARTSNTFALAFNKPDLIHHNHSSWTKHLPICLHNVLKDGFFKFYHQNGDSQHRVSQIH